MASMSCYTTSYYLSSGVILFIDSLSMSNQSAAAITCCVQGCLCTLSVLDHFVSGAAYSSLVSPSIDILTALDTGTKLTKLTYY